MEKIIKTGLVGLLVFGSTVCVAQDLEVCVSASYTIPSVVGVSGATYQWLENGTVIPGANSESYANVEGKTDAGTYMYVRRALKEGCGWQSSNVFIVSVTGSASAPTISRPADGCAGIDYVFTVPMMSNATYQWTGGGTDNSNSYTYSKAAAGALTVTVLAVVPSCTYALSGATATAYDPPVINSISADPPGVCLGGTTTLTVSADNATAYQWQKGSSNVLGGSGANTSTYITAPVTESTVYSVVVANGACSTTSENVPVSSSDCYTAPGATVDFPAFSPDSDAAPGSTWTLRDTRDGGHNRTYKVKKMADLRIWMVEDLKFGDCNTTDTWRSDQTELSTTRTPTVYADASHTYVGHCTAATKSSTPDNRGYLYNWPAAMQSGFAYYSSSSSYFACSGTAGGNGQSDPGYCQGICPSGWHIPTGGGSGSEFKALYDGIVASDNNSTPGDNFADFQTVDDDPKHWHGVLGGHCDENASLVDQGNYAAYWSSTWYSENAASSLRFNSTTVEFNFGSKRYGRTVRCVMNYD
jgi:uncharacterized protein (TIGR02145 family)